MIFITLNSDFIKICKSITKRFLYSFVNNLCDWFLFSLINLFLTKRNLRDFQHPYAIKEWLFFRYHMIELMYYAFIVLYHTTRRRLCDAQDAQPIMVFMWFTIRLNIGNRSSTLFSTQCSYNVCFTYFAALGRKSMLSKHKLFCLESVPLWLVSQQLRCE